MDQRIVRFFFPSLTPGFLFRVACVTLFSILFFGKVCTPFYIRGKSMEMTYADGSFTFILKARYLLSEPRRGDVVAVRLAGERVVLLKRVVALEGETVAFKDGRLHVNGAPVEEPYVEGPCDWNLEPRKVEPGCLYFVGDNRSMPMENHDFGQASAKRVVGAPLW